MGHALLEALLGAVAFTGSSAGAATDSFWQPVVLAEYSGAATDSRIQSRGCGWFEVAWRAPDGIIASRGYHSGMMQPLTTHGPGRDPVLSLGSGGVYLAWSNGNEVKITSNAGNWQTPVTLTSGFGLPTHHADFCASIGSFDPDIAWLEGSRVIFAAALPTGGWAAPEVVAVDATPNEYFGLQVETTLAPRARVYYFNNNFALVYRERIAPGVWSAPSMLPPEHSDLAWPFRVAVRGGFYGLHSILHVGLFRTCPCNEIYFATEGSQNQWLPPERLTIERDAFDFPQYCGLTVTPDGTAHCVWYQQFLNFMMQPSGEETFYRQRTPEGQWIDPGDIGLAPGRYTDAASGDCVGGSNAPEFCWIESAPSGSRVMVLRNTLTGSAVTGATEAARLVVTPNPARGATTIAWMNAPRGLMRLDIFAANGRRVRTLESERAIPFLWNGRSDSGSEVPAGTYWFRLTASSRTATASAVLVR